MLFALLYLVVRRLFGLAGGSGSEDLSQGRRDPRPSSPAEVLRRQKERPRLRRLDRVVRTAASRVLPRPAWSSFVVSPPTLLRWHRELVRRKWTYRGKHRVGRPPLDAAACELILRLARENRRWGCVRIQGELAKLGEAVAVMPETYEVCCSLFHGSDWPLWPVGARASHARRVDRVRPAADGRARRTAWITRG